ncbi:MAG TPA: D-aminoacyl-tRNA deacylase [Armatimonadota bacterium]|jgi:D-tyrosyl-tRNA(Tyr) deacylase
MRALVQRVSEAHVIVDGETVGEISHGLLILLGIGEGDTAELAAKMAAKCANLRILEDEQGKMNRSLLDSGGRALVVSQFTLYADCRKGRRPSFTGSAGPEEGERLYDSFCGALRELGIGVETGVFRAHMDVQLHNDGPVTIWLDSDEIC